MAANYYMILGVSLGSSQEEIKQAYRRKAKELHPDRYGDDAGPFLKVQEAYAVLSDPGRRRAYDQRIRPRHTVRSRRGFREVRAVRHPPPARFNTSVKQPIQKEMSLTGSFESFVPSFEEIFERLWSNFTGAARPKSERAESLTVDVPLSPEEAAAGGEVDVLVPAALRCPNCSGYGRVGPYECLQCHGRGAVADEYPVRISFPGGIGPGHTATVPLEGLGIRNLFLIVRIRPA